MEKHLYVELNGEKIEAGSLLLPKAIEFWRAVMLSDFSEILFLLRTEGGNEIVVFETEVEVGQHATNDIRKIERIAVEFFAEDRDMPKVYALRDTFPILPHQYLERTEKPRSLCLYEMPYDEVRVFWTGFLYLQRIREWLCLSAKGELHQDDQPLEPLLIGEQGTVLFPANIQQGDEVFLYFLTKDYYGRVNLFISKQENLNGKKFYAVIEFLTGESQVHGVFRYAPVNFAELSDFLSCAGIDLQNFLKEKLLSYKSADLKKQLLLFFQLPKKRNGIESVETNDFYVFLSADTLEALGSKLGLWQMINSNLGYVLNPTITKDALSQCIIGMLKPIPELTRPLARIMNGIKSDLNPKIVAIGMGALGSQFFLNLVRAGVGIWTIVDADVFLPHNLARHALFGEDILGNKVYQVAHKATSILNEEGAILPLLLDAIRDREDAELVEKISCAEYLIDVSASPSVLKVLSEYDTKARVVSFFVNSTGEDLVLLAEDKLKSISISQIEVQYLRSILITKELHSHFSSNTERIRYSSGCRDISSDVPQDSIALAAALSSKVFKHIMSCNSPLISIWHTDMAGLTTARYDFPVYTPVEVKLGNWILSYDEYFINRVYELRASRLPNETGGILLGNYDMERKRIYVLEVIHSPEDSIEYPTAYIRGIKDIARDLQNVSSLTSGTIQYIGEWHTHPEGYSSSPSEDDIILINWLAENMSKETLPALMFIAGDNHDFNFYLGEHE